MPQSKRDISEKHTGVPAPHFLHTFAALNSVLSRVNNYVKHSYRDPLHDLYLIVSGRIFIHAQADLVYEIRSSFTHSQVCKQMKSKRNSYLSDPYFLLPLTSPSLSTASLLRGLRHYGNHDISSMLVVRFCSRDGVNEKRKWRIKRAAAKEGEEEMMEGVEGKERERCCWCLWIPSLQYWMLPGQLQHVGLTVCLLSIPCEAS